MSLFDNGVIQGEKLPHKYKQLWMDMKENGRILSKAVEDKVKKTTNKQQRFQHYEEEKQGQP